MILNNIDSCFCPQCLGTEFEIKTTCNLKPGHNNKYDKYFEASNIQRQIVCVNCQRAYYKQNKHTSLYIKMPQQ